MIREGGGGEGRVYRCVSELRLESGLGELNNGGYQEEKESRKAKEGGSAINKKGGR